MKIVYQAALPTLTAIGLLAFTACTPASTLPPEHSDELTDPIPVRAPYFATPVPTPSAPVARESAMEDLATPAPARVTVPVAELLSRYLADASGGPGVRAEWYANVRQVTVQFNTAIIRTDLTAAPLDQEKAQTICQIAAQFPNSAQGARRRGIAVQVYGQGSRLLASSRDVTAQHQDVDGFLVGAHSP